MAVAGPRACAPGNIYIAFEQALKRGIELRFLGPIKFS